MATPSDIKASTDACAREPIHIPSSIQPHGLFFALREADLLLAAVSENAAAQLQTTPQQLIVGTIGRFLDDASAESLCTDAARRSARRHHHRAASGSRAP